jgi:flagella basal body P-ring formation protein FlgA
MILLAFAAACLAVAPQSDRVFARDLAPQFPALLQAPPDAVAGFAPSPGVNRVFNVPELTRLAGRLEIKDAPESEICVERPVVTLNPAALLEAMRKVLPDAQIDIEDFSRIPAPQGELEFRLADLHPGPPGGAIWRASVRYAGTRRFTIWAKVKVSQTAVRVTAIGDLPAGQPIAPGMILVRTLSVFPEPVDYAVSAESVAGKIPRIPIRAGSEIRLDTLDAPKDVMRGDTVKVEVSIGGARLALDAIAETSGSAGAQILVRNPVSNKIFSARVEGKGRASVSAPVQKGIQ